MKSNDEGELAGLLLPDFRGTISAYALDVDETGEILDYYACLPSEQRC